MARAGEMHLLQRELAAQHLPALVLNSWIFASAGHDRLTRRNVGERTLCLVRATDVTAARATAQTLGYPLGTAIVDRLIDARQSILTIDVQPGWMPRTAAAQSILDGWWERADVVRVGGQDLQTLSRRDWLLHLALGCGPALRGMDLQSARDITHLVHALSASDVSAAMHDAETLGLGHRFAAALMAATTALDATPPSPGTMDTPTVLGARAQDPRVRRLALGRATTLSAAVPPRRRARKDEHSLGQFAASSDAAIAAMLTMAEVGRGMRVLDLGCGDGRLVIAAAQRGAEAIGIDSDAARIAEARVAAASAGVSAAFTTGDAFTMPLPTVDVVTLYVAPPAVDPIVRRIAQSADDDERDGRHGRTVKVVVHNGRLDPDLPERLTFIRRNLFRVSAVAMWRV
jgi:predicted RNA methylase